MSYSIRYTISAFSGAYAMKYSVVIHEAQRLNALLGLAKADACLEGFAAGGDVRRYDGYDTFNAIMKVLKFVMKNSKRTFCTHIERESEGQVECGERFVDEDDEGAFEVVAYGKTGILVRDGAESSFEEILGKRGKYRACLETMPALFKEDLMSLLNLCEQTMSSNAQMIATQVANDVPAAEPLIQI